MGSTTIKKVRGKEYLYYSYYDNGKKISSYCGLAGKPESSRKAYEYEMEELTKQKQLIVKRLATLTKKIQCVDT